MSLLLKIVTLSILFVSCATNQKNNMRTPSQADPIPQCIPRSGDFSAGDQLFFNEISRVGNPLAMEQKVTIKNGACRFSVSLPGNSMMTTTNQRLTIVNQSQGRASFSILLRSETGREYSIDCNALRETPSVRDFYNNIEVLLSEMNIVYPQDVCSTFHEVPANFREESGAGNTPIDL